MKKTFLSLCVVSLLSLTAFSDESITQQDTNELNHISSASTLPKLSSSDTIDDWADKALQSFGISEFGENNGKFFIFAQQSVMLKPTDPQFGDAVINAYDKALVKLQEKYVMLRFGKITTDKIKSLYSDRSTNAKQLELPKPKEKGFLSKLMLVLDTKLDVMGAKLDDELVDLGVDRNSIKDMTPAMKKDLYRNKFIKNTMRSAQGSIAGLIPIQTSIASDNKGTYSIGVIAVASPKTIQIAKDISLKRKSIITGKGRDLTALLPTSNEQFLGTFGTRLAYDLDGSPVILSYGIASYLPDTGDDYINDELKADARSAAIANADAQIAELINGKMNIKAQKQSGEETKKYVERELKQNSDTIEKTIKNIIKITDKTAKSSASAKLQGISTIKKWRYTSPDKHKYVGVVRAWKYSTLKAVENFNHPSRQKAKQNKRDNYNGASQMQSSEPINTINDF